MENGELPEFSESFDLGDVSNEIELLPLWASGSIPIKDRGDTQKQR